MSAETVKTSITADVEAYEGLLNHRLLRSRYQIEPPVAGAISKSPLDRMVDRIIRRAPSGTWKMVDLRTDPGGHRRLARAYSGEATATRICSGQVHRYVIDAVTACLLMPSAQHAATVVEIGPAMPSITLAAAYLGHESIYSSACVQCADFALACAPDLKSMHALGDLPARGGYVIFTGIDSAIPADLLGHVRYAEEFRFRFDAGLVSLIGRIRGGRGQVEYAPAWPLELRQHRTVVVRQPVMTAGEALSERLDRHEILDFSLFCEMHQVGLERLRVQDDSGVNRPAIGSLRQGFFAIDLRGGQSIGSADGLSFLRALLDQFRDAGFPRPKDYEVRLSMDSHCRYLLPTIYPGGG